MSGLERQKTASQPPKRLQKWQKTGYFRASSSGTLEWDGGQTR